MKIRSKINIFLTIILALMLISTPVWAEENPNLQISLTQQGNTRVNNQKATFSLENSKQSKETQKLPESYDLRNVNGKNYVTPVKDQGDFGTCWAHSAISCSETNSMLKGGSNKVDLSEKSLAWFAYQLQGTPEATNDELEGVMGADYKIDNLPYGFDIESNIYFNGGLNFTASTQLSNWLAASTEEQTPYTNENGDMDEYKGEIFPSALGDWTLDYFDIYNNAFHLQNSEVIDGPGHGNSVEDYVRSAKALMMKSGSLNLNYFSVTNGSNNNFFNDQTNAQYCPPEDKRSSNHAVTVVGWDDNFPKENFKITPPGNGAWIIKNSWGLSWGDNGYFYLSYYDSTIVTMVSFDVETPQLGYSYDRNYQYDYMGDRNDFLPYLVGRSINDKISSNEDINSDQCAFANVFTSEEYELLEAVSAYTVFPSGEVTAKVYLLNNDYSNPTDGQLVGTVTKEFENQGFYTLELPESVSLEPGQKFSVVENIIYPVECNNQVIKVPTLSIEYGLEEPLEGSLINDKGQDIGFVMRNYTVNANADESYVYGLSGKSNNSDAWNDITDPEVYDQLRVESYLYTLSGYQEVTYIPGNCMIKAYTSLNVLPGVIKPSGLNFNMDSINLSTNASGQRSVEVEASVTPSNAIGTINYSVYPEEIATVTQEGNTAKVTAVSEGTAKLVARTVNGYVATTDITVSNNSFLVDDVTVNNINQDYIEVEINNLHSNPAFDKTLTPSTVSVYVWSDKDMTDVQIVPAHLSTNEKSWVTQRIGINNTYSYVLDATHLKYSVYVGSENNALDEMVFSGYTSWVQPGLEQQGNVSYIAYNQNVGFVEPTIHSGVSGKIDDPESVHMEGLRISSGISGVNVITTVHAADLGWLEPKDDGEYSGTMHQNRALEAIKLELDSTLNNYEIYYRVYVTGSGWTNWVKNGEIAGTTGQALPIQAVDVQIDKIQE